MSKHLIVVIIVFLNVIFFLLHYKAFRKSRETRKIWAACTIGAGIGSMIYYLPDLVYGFPVDILILVRTILSIVTGSGMYFLNRYGSRSGTTN